MLPHTDRERLDAARQLAERQLLAGRNAGGSWHGRLSSSPLATAAALSALVLAEQHVDDQPSEGQPGHDTWLSGVLFRTELNQLVITSLRWLADRQNADGGWGDAEQSPSTLAATLMVQTAFQLTAVPAKYAGMIERAEEFTKKAGGAAALRNGAGAFNPTLASCILAAAAAADLANWRHVHNLRLEGRLLSPAIRRLIFSVEAERLSAPAMAFGLARAKHAPRRNPLARFWQRAARPRILKALAAQQGQPGDFRGSPLETSLVVIGLASAGYGNDWVVRRGVEFLFSSVGPEGCWSADGNRAVENTAGAALALDWEFPIRDDPTPTSEPSPDAIQSLDWLLRHQRSEAGSLGAKFAAGWSASDDLREPANVLTTASVLAALVSWQRRWSHARRGEIQRAAAAGAAWLVDQQRPDGGWGYFAKRSIASSDRSTPDATAEALRALAAVESAVYLLAPRPGLTGRVAAAIAAGRNYITKSQGANGSWNADWFASPSAKKIGSPLVGTSLAVESLADVGALAGESVARGLSWLATVQDSSGGWGPIAKPLPGAGATRNGTPPAAPPQPTVEETCRAVKSLARAAATDPRALAAVESGLNWLAPAILESRVDGAPPIALSCDRLWQGDQATASIQAASALRIASRVLPAVPPVEVASASPV